MSSEPNRLSRDSVYVPMGTGMSPSSDETSTPASPVGGHVYTDATHKPSVISEDKMDSTSNIRKLANAVFNVIGKMFSSLKEQYLTVKDRVFNQKDTITRNGEAIKVQLPYPKTMSFKADDIVKSDANDLKAILAMPNGFKALIAASKQNHSEENLYFLASLKHLSSLISDNNESEANHVWNQIQEQFLNPGATLEVNLKENTLSKLNKSSTYLFSSDFKMSLDNVRNEIELLLNDDKDLQDKAWSSLDKMEQERKAIEDQRKMDAQKMNNSLKDAGLI